MIKEPLEAKRKVDAKIVDKSSARAPTSILPLENLRRAQSAKVPPPSNPMTPTAPSTRAAMKFACLMSKFVIPAKKQWNERIDGVCREVILTHRKADPHIVGMLSTLLYGEPSISDGLPDRPPWLHEPAP
ncbi:MAG: hypothetical protein IPL01_05860 [Acidobacteria bacterium]|nr:hypothetical protein [Acidobacteriota bacterium]